MEKQPITKIIANSGFCSRRKAESLIRKKQVYINNNLAILGDKVKNEDTIKINNQIINTNNNLIYYILNKPQGYTCTNKNFKNEKNVFELINEKQKLNIVGRLDKDSQGLILLTNDGEITYKLTHPSFEHKKVYKVEVNYLTKPINKIIKTFKQGINIGEKKIAIANEIKFIDNKIFIITLKQGQNRQIRRMFAYFNINVLKIKRLSLGPLKLKNLPEGKYRKLEKKEIQELKKIN